MELLAGILIYGAVIAFTFLLAYAVQQNTYRGYANSLERFARDLEEPSLRLDTSAYPSLNKTSLEGKLDEREVLLRFRIVGGGKSKRAYVCFEVDVANSAADFRVARAGFFDRVGRALGIVSDVPVGDAQFDSDYLVSGAGGQLRALFKARHLGEQLDRVSRRYGLASIELANGKLRFERILSKGLEPGLLRRTFEALLEVAQQCERRPVQVKVLGKKPHFAWTGGSETARCPYCHDSIDIDGEDVSACQDCDTVHHRECLEEAGGCTIFGCAGRPSDRQRA